MHRVTSLNEPIEDSQSGTYSQIVANGHVLVGIKSYAGNFDTAIVENSHVFLTISPTGIVTIHRAGKIVHTDKP